MQRSRGFLGLFIVAGVFISAWAQSPSLPPAQTALIQQLQREYPGVLVYTEGNQVRLSLIHI
ncbi:MAG: hypothetical protein N2651_05305, partial [Fimbriimonadales bacterium]|nr:hypothetical protein [Fimbriimonadales bacterium]